MGMAGSMSMTSMGGWGSAAQIGGQLLAGQAQSRAYGQQAAEQAYQGVMAKANAEADADSILDAAAQHASKLRKLTAREVSSARAATAASGVALDDFALGNMQAIDQAGEEDAAVAILNGDRQALTTRRGGDSAARAAGINSKNASRASRDAFLGAMVGAAGKGYSGWKGAQAPDNGLTTGDFARMDRGQS